MSVNYYVTKKNSSSAGTYYFRLTAVENSTSVSNNTSNVTFIWKIWQSSTSTKWSMGAAYASQWPQLNLYVGGSLVAQTKIQTFKVSSSDEDDAYIAQYTTDIAHSSDGTGSVTCYGNWTVFSGTSGASYGPATFTTDTQTLTLTTIARASTLTVSPTSLTITSSNLSSVVTATISAKSSSFTHSLTWALGNGSGSATASTTVTYSTLLAALNTANSGTMTWKLITYNGSTTVGTKTATISVAVDLTSFRPSVTLGSISSNHTLGLLIAGYCTASATYSTTKNSSAQSVTTSFTYTNCSGSTSSTTSTGGTLTTNTLPSSSSNYNIAIDATAKDSRGATTASATRRTATVYGYTNPTITLSAYRVAANNSTTEDAAGTYLYVVFSSALTNNKLGSNNSIQSLSGTFSTALVDASNSTSTTTATSGHWYELAESSSVTITITTADKVTSATKTLTISQAVFSLDLYESGSTVGVGVGAIAEAGRFTVALPADFGSFIYDKADNVCIGSPFINIYDETTDSSMDGQLQQIIDYIGSSDVWGQYPLDSSCRTSVLTIYVYGGRWSLYGFYGSANYGSFFAHSYKYNKVYHVYKNGGTWSYDPILIGDRAASVASLTSSGAISGTTISGTTLATTGAASINAQGQGMFTSVYDSSLTNLFRTGALQLREAGRVGNTQTDIKYAPAIGFHWGNIAGKTLAMGSDGVFYFLNQNGTTPSRVNLYLDEGQGNPTIWTGTCKGGSYVSLDVSAYSGLWIYFMHYLVVSRTYLDLTKASAGNDVDTTYVYNTGASTGYYVNSRWECHYAHFGVPSTKNQVKVINAGYTYNSTNGLRNSNANYYMYRIDGVY